MAGASESTRGIRTLPDEAGGLTTGELDWVIHNAALATTDNAITRFDGIIGNLQNSGITIADGASGALSGTNTGDQTITLTGDIIGSGTGSFATTLASIITAGGPTGSATVAPIITYDAKGRLTAVSSATIAPAASSITD